MELYINVYIIFVVCEKSVCNYMVLLFVLFAICSL